MSEQTTPRRWSSRKLAIAIGANVVYVALLVLGHLKPEHFQTLTIWTLGTYFAGNVGEHLVKRK